MDGEREFCTLVVARVADWPVGWGLYPVNSVFGRSPQPALDGLPLQ